MGHKREGVMNPELKKRDKEQAAQLKEAKKRWLKELEEEPKVECIVRNHDFLNQGVPIEFTFRRVKKYTIKDGETITLPLSVYNHINSMQVPAPVTVQDFQTGQMKTDFSHKRARFTATLTEKGVASLQSMVSAPARKTKEASQ